MLTSNRLVIIDRDGTLNVERQHLIDPAGLELIDNASDGIRLIRGLGLRAVVVTNQSVIGRGSCSYQTLEKIHDRLRELLEAGGAVLDAIYFCPHRPDEGCACRKPMPGLLYRAAEDFNADLSRAFVIGDKAIDIEVGKRVGATTLLVRTGYGSEVEAQGETKPDYVVSDIGEAAVVISGLIRMEQVDSRQRVCLHLLNSGDVKRRVAELCTDGIVKAASLVTASLQSGGKAMFCGNGGSAADSQHLAAEFTSRLRSDMERPAMAALALTTDTSFITARANDYCFEEVFERQIQAIGRAGDVLVGISTSGNSKNVIRAVQVCKTKQIRTIGFLGTNGGTLQGLVDVAITVPSNNTQHIQESHISIGHILCELVEDAIFG